MAVRHDENRRKMQVGRPGRGLCSGLVQQICGGEYGHLKHQAYALNARIERPEWVRMLTAGNLRNEQAFESCHCGIGSFVVVVVGIFPEPVLDCPFDKNSET